MRQTTYVGSGTAVQRPPAAEATTVAQAGAGCTAGTAARQPHTSVGVRGRSAVGTLVADSPVGGLWGPAVGTPHPAVGTLRPAVGTLRPVVGRPLPLVVGLPAGSRRQAAGTWQTIHQSPSG